MRGENGITPPFIVIRKSVLLIRLAKRTDIAQSDGPAQFMPKRLKCVPVRIDHANRRACKLHLVTPLGNPCAH
jgi:hypothetical protein